MSIRDLTDDEQRAMARSFEHWRDTGSDDPPPDLEPGTLDEDPCPLEGQLALFPLHEAA